MEQLHWQEVLRKQCDKLMWTGIESALVHEYLCGKPSMLIGCSSACVLHSMFQHVQAICVQQ
jgi:hypothetical protein